MYSVHLHLAIHSTRRRNFGSIAEKKTNCASQLMSGAPSPQGSALSALPNADARPKLLALLLRDSSYMII